MKKLVMLFLLMSSLIANAQNLKLEKLWETDTIVAIPESVLPDFKNQTLYVSLIAGGPWDADGVGGIGKLSFDGKKYDGDWIKGLNAPKGLGKYGDKLYAADISEVVVVNMKKGEIESRIAIEGASGLNDITVDDKGVVYVSDSKTSKIWQIKNGKPTLYLENVNGANGLLAVKDGLIYAQGKSLMKANGKKELTKIADVTEGIDGIEPVGNGDYIVTSWVGLVYYVKSDGQFQTLLDSRPEKKNAADIGYDPAKKIVYVPTFMGKTVAAYQLR